MAIKSIAKMSDMLKIMILSVLFFTKPLIFFFKDYYKRDKIRFRKTYADRLPPSFEKGIHQIFKKNLNFNTILFH